MSFWYSTTDRDLDAIRLYCRHYSRRHYRDGRHNLRQKGFAGVGEQMVLITARADALFVWQYSKLGHANGQKGVCCSIFRNEGAYKSSELIQEATILAKQRWPGKRLFTYVNPQKIQSTNPGYCFLRAGWRRCGKTKGDLIILEEINGEVSE